MRDATVSSMPCTREYGVMAQGKAGGRAAAHAGRAAPASPADAL
jgi:hypothetical protein